LNMMKEPSMQLKAAAPLGTRIETCFMSRKVMMEQCRDQPLRMSDSHLRMGGFRRYI
jgi:hypothetical protein